MYKYYFINAIKSQQNHALNFLYSPSLTIFVKKFHL